MVLEKKELTLIERFEQHASSKAARRGSTILLRTSPL